MRNLVLTMGAAAFIITIAAGAAPANAAPGDRARTLGNAQSRPPAAINRPVASNAATPSQTRPANQRSTHITAGNTVVVAPGHPSNGYYDNGHYHPPQDWDDDDDEFLEFVGKTAAVTAGASIVTAVIGSVVNSKPQEAGCKETISNGQAYVNCNGTWYQAVPPSGAAPAPAQYQVVPPPQS